MVGQTIMAVYVPSRVLFHMVWIEFPLTVGQWLRLRDGRLVEDMAGVGHRCLVQLPGVHLAGNGRIWRLYSFALGAGS